MPRNSSVLIKTTAGTVLAVVLLFDFLFAIQVQAAVSTRVSQVSYLDGYAQVGAVGASDEQNKVVGNTQTQKGAQALDPTQKTSNAIPATNNTSPESVPDISNGWSEFFSKTAPENFASATPQESYQYDNNQRPITNPNSIPQQITPPAQKTPVSDTVEDSYQYGAAKEEYQYAPDDRQGTKQTGENYGYANVNPSPNTQGVTNSSNSNFGSRYAGTFNSEDLNWGFGILGTVMPFGGLIGLGVRGLIASGIPVTYDWELAPPPKDLTTDDEANGLSRSGFDPVTGMATGERRGDISVSSAPLDPPKDDFDARMDRAMAEIAADKAAGKGNPPGELDSTQTGGLIGGIAGFFDGLSKSIGDLFGFGEDAPTSGVSTPGQSTSVEVGAVSGEAPPSTNGDLETSRPGPGTNSAPSSNATAPDYGPALGPSHGPGSPAVEVPSAPGGAPPSGGLVDIDESGIPGSSNFSGFSGSTEIEGGDVEVGGDAPDGGEGEGGDGSDGGE